MTRRILIALLGLALLPTAAHAKQPTKPQPRMTLKQLHHTANLEAMDLAHEAMHYTDSQDRPLRLPKGTRPNTFALLVEARHPEHMRIPTPKVYWFDSTHEQLALQTGIRR